MKKIKSFGWHIVDGICHFLHDPITKIRVFIITVDKFFCLFHALLSYLLQIVVNVVVSFQFEEKWIYFFFFVKDDPYNLLKSAWELKELLEFISHFPKIAVLIVFKAPIKFFFHHSCIMSEIF